jgi:trehalose 6-phosphate synthase
VLWPLCHAALGTVESCGDAWADYRRVNDQFADAMAGAAADADGEPLVWLHDYHLALAPRQLRERTGGEGSAERPPLPGSRDGPTLAHTWHIPWPSWDTFRACPNREAVLDGLLGNDLLAFHVPRYCENFLRSADRGLDGAAVDFDAGTVDYRGRTTTVRAAPMGVPVDRIREQADSAEATGFRAAFRKNRGIDRDTRLAVGVDRLDYTKGIVERLRALEHLFETRPRWRGELTYVQSASESRSAIPAYRALQSDVEAAVERINDRFSTDDWRPVVYTTDWLDREELAGLYRHADVALVSPIRDGMNLVAQEYVAAQVENDGVLVLSETAGAHDVLGEHAVSVVPTDVAAFADRIEDALTMGASERRRRMAGLRRWVGENDLDSWTDGFLRAATARTGRQSAARAAIGATRPQRRP